jgi:hypothetical protein
MPFNLEEIGDNHPHRDISSFDGVEMELWENASPLEDEQATQEFPGYANGFKNEELVRVALKEAGVLYTPEIPAFSRDGRELALTKAYYVDKRIGKKSVWDIDHWIRELVTAPKDSEHSERELSEFEVSTLVGLAMDELGITEKLQQIRREDAERAEVAPILPGRTSEDRAHSGYGFDEESPEHLAPRDDI